MDPGSNPLSRNGIYDPFSPEVIDDPYPFYRGLLRDSRVHHEEEHDLWVLTRYDDVQRAPLRCAVTAGSAPRDR